MKNKKIIIWIVSIIGISIIVCIGFFAYIIKSLDYGPFHATKIEPIEISDNVMRFQLSENGEFIIDNRIDTLSPVLTFIENRTIKWTLEMNEITEIGDVSITSIDPIRFYFIWFNTHSYGVDRGRMKINKRTGKNKFYLNCL